MTAERESDPLDELRGVVEAGTADSAGLYHGSFKVMAAAILWIDGFPVIFKRKVIPETAPIDELRTCRGCGDLYHPSWGSICPNCSGAD